MAGRVVNFASNGKLGTLNLGTFHDEIPAADCGRPMYEVISILLRNVVQHSRIESGQQATFEHIVEVDQRRMILRNLVCDEAERDALVKRAEDAIARPFDDWALGTSPGGTGFVRIRKLLKQAGFSRVDFTVRGLSAPYRFETQIVYSK